MARFVVTSGGTTTALRERRTPSLNGTLTGTTYSLGSLIVSSERRIVHERGQTFPDTWRRVGTNRWVNQILAMGAVNMIPVTDLNPVTLTVRTGSSTALNVRRGPGTVFPTATTNNSLANGTRVVPTHSATPPTNFSPNNRGAWVRIGANRWVLRSLLN